MVVNWYKFFSKDKKSIYNKSLEQINHYRDLVYKKRNFFLIMQVIILAGGLGTRLAEYTKPYLSPWLKFWVCQL